MEVHMFSISSSNPYIGLPLINFNPSTHKSPLPFNPDDETLFNVNSKVSFNSSTFKNIKESNSKTGVLIYNIFILPFLNKNKYTAVIVKANIDPRLLSKNKVTIIKAISIADNTLMNLFLVLLIHKISKGTQKLMLPL
ncbi:hypothetical protein RYX51_22600 (plasmid) [Priestia filamentosa]|nr:hypothetical protein RYX51_22600 [Priestia filamentosa]